jgi:hypothetical protein
VAIADFRMQQTNVVNATNGFSMGQHGTIVIEKFNGIRDISGLSRPATHGIKLHMKIGMGLRMPKPVTEDATGKHHGQQ